MGGVTSGNRPRDLTGSIFGRLEVLRLVYSKQVCVEGDVESGPYALKQAGVRWGQLHIWYTANGRTYLTTCGRKTTHLWREIELDGAVLDTLSSVAYYGNEEAALQNRLKELTKAYHGVWRREVDY